MNNTLSPLLTTKFEYLKNILKESNGCVIAFSGGIDSSFLTYTAHQVLNGHCLAVIGDSPTYPRREYQAALEWLNEHTIAYKVINTEEYKHAAFRQNPPERCYYCKLELFSKIREVALQQGYSTIIEGSNINDEADFRPGRKALKKTGVISPMIQAGLTKDDIREITKKIYKLPIFDKPASACLSSRFQYGTEITEDRLARIEAMENFLFEQGFRIFRARFHKDMLRLEVGEEEFDRFSNRVFRKQCIDLSKQLGFKYISLDLQGFRSGSANEVLSKEVIASRK